MVYVATGNNYADPSQPTTDAVLALDMNSGTRKWVNQITPNDNWTLGCGPVNPDNANCPEKLGPDYDFSASPSLVTVNGRDLLVLPQKSGMAYTLDPDNEGHKVWGYRIGQGSGLGGQWGGAVDGQNAYFGVSDLLSQKPGGIRAVNLATGQLAWSVEPQTRLCDTAKPTCRASQGAAVTAIPGAVFSGSLDGGMRAYSTKDGSVLWTSTPTRNSRRSTASKRAAAASKAPAPSLLAACCSSTPDMVASSGIPGMSCSRLALSNHGDDMKRTSVLVALVLFLFVAASPSSAQLLAAKDGPIVYGHHHVAASDIAAHKKFWADTLGGTVGKFGNNAEIVKFPNVLIFFRDQKPTGGTIGTTANHIGFSVPNLARWSTR